MPHFRLSMRFETKQCSTSGGYQTESKRENSNTIMQLTHEVPQEVFVGMRIEKMSHTSSNPLGNCVECLSWGIMETGVSTWIPGVGGEPLHHSLDVQKWQKERKRSKWRARVYSMHLSCATWGRESSREQARLQQPPEGPQHPGCTVKSRAGPESWWGLGCLWFHRLTGPAQPLGTWGADV